MPAKRKFVRRFEPRYGVSAEMLETEATYVARERVDYALLSVNELRQKLVTVGQMYSIVNGVLAKAVESLSEREQLAVRCLVTRDLYLILELFCTHLGVVSNSAGTGASAAVATRAGRSPAPAVPFSEWLFETGTNADK